MIPLEQQNCPFGVYVFHYHLPRKDMVVSWITSIISQHYVASNKSQGDKQLILVNIMRTHKQHNHEKLYT